MPIPGGHVILTLADGKRLNLPQTMSGSGIRYANADELFVFWSKGDTAFVEEGPRQTQTYSGCVGQKKKRALSPPAHLRQREANNAKRRAQRLCNLAAMQSATTSFGAR